MVIAIGLKMTSRKVITSFASSGSDVMDGHESELLNRNTRGTVQSGILSSSLKTDSDITQTLPLTPDGCEIGAQNEVHEVPSVVQPSDTNKNDAPQSSTETDQINRVLFPFSGPGSTKENQNVAIENNNVFVFLF